VEWVARRPITTNELFAVTHGKDLFVAVGDRGTVVTSTNGISWRLQSSPASVALRAVTFTGVRFIAGGDFGYVMNSFDGINWTIASPTSFHIKGLASSGHGAVVAVGENNGGGRLHASVNGLSWPGYSLEFSNALRGVTYRSDCFVAVGDNGTILWSNGLTEGLTNSWTNAVAGRWEDPSWSLPELPWIGQSAILFTNSGSKSLTISSNTAAAYPGSLSLPSLAVDAPAGDVNELRLDHAGLDVALSVRDRFVVGPNGSLVSSGSAVLGGITLLSGPATFREGSIASFANLLIGGPAPVAVNLDDSSIAVPGEMILADGGAVTINQRNGTNISGRLVVRGRGSYNATNVVLDVNTLEVQTPGTGTVSSNSEIVTAQFNAVATSIHLGEGGLRLGWTPDGTTGRGQGRFLLAGGLLFSPSINVTGGAFEQTDGTTRVAQLSVTSVGVVTLSGGTLYTTNLLVSDSLTTTGQRSRFVQKGGIHWVLELVSLSNSGVYQLQSGTLDTYGIVLGRSAELRVEGGTLHILGVFSINGGTFYATGENLYFGSLSVVEGGTIELLPGRTVLRFLDSADVSWGTGEGTTPLVIRNWNGSTNGGGTHQIRFDSAHALRPDQLSRFRFIDPAGLPPEVYPARLLGTGELVPEVRPAMSFARNGTKMVVSWSGNYQLLSATNVIGPYTLVSGAVSPYTNGFVDAHRFFRLSSP